MRWAEANSLRNHTDNCNLRESEYLVDKGDDCRIALSLYCNSENHCCKNR